MPTPLTLADQFAFCPTGSTTAALVTILQDISELLTTNDHVVVISMDFTKAFDSFRHSAIAETLSRLDIPDCIFNWFNYLNGRKHATCFNGQISTTKNINASVVQGSAGGPGMYITGTSDLRPVNDVNKLQIYADDTYLLIGSNNIDSAQPELLHLQEWAKSKNLHINPSQTREMAVVGRLRPSLALRQSVTGAVRSTSIKILGVTIGERLTVSQHVDLTVRPCASSLYALRVLREH